MPLKLRVTFQALPDSPLAFKRSGHVINFVADGQTLLYRVIEQLKTHGKPISLMLNGEADSNDITTAAKVGYYIRAQQSVVRSDN
jgi:hypothetical protein